MKLTTPPEPLELKAWMLALRGSNPTNSEVNTSVIWAGNKLPKYLWDHWKAQMKLLGFNWQKFMRVLGHRTDLAIMWYSGSINWHEFISKIIELVQGPIGEDMRIKSSREVERPINIARLQFPPPKDWEEFERLCASLWSKIWDYQDVQLIGRKGQRQNGVDIHGTIGSSGKCGGIQCKKKDATSPDDLLTVEQMREIVDEAKSFRPALTELVIAYTGKRDAKIQEVARRITEEHRQEGFFRVTVFSWEDIMEKLGDYPEVAQKHFPELASSNFDLRKIERDIHDIKDTLEADKNIDITTISASLGIVAKEAAQSAAELTAVSGEHSAELDHARDLINSFKWNEALKFLGNIESRIWNQLTNINRFRLLTNKASALASLGRDPEAGKLFIKAFQYNQDDEKAICNRALGHLLIGQVIQAKKFAEEVIRRNPVSERAYGILINCLPDANQLEQILQIVPAELRKTADVAYAIAHKAHKQGDIETAIQWLEVAYEDSGKDGKENPDLGAHLASTILQSFEVKREIVSGTHISPEVRSKILHAIDLFNKAINAISASESIGNRAFWLSNRGIAYKLIGNLEKALSDTEEAVRIQPDSTIFRKQKAFILHLKGDENSAIDILRKIIDEPEVPEARLILAQILYEKGEGEEARKILRDALEGNIPDELRSEEQYLLIHIYLKETNFEEARKISFSMRSINLTNVLTLVIAARIERLDGKTDDAVNLLNEARGYITESTYSHHFIALADEFYALERYSDAWPLYERVSDPRVNSPLLNKLLYSYYRAGEVEKALRIFKLMPSENKNSFLIQVELSILESIGDLKEAAASAKSYLEITPDDLEIRVHLATIWFRLDECEKLDEFLKEHIIITALPIEAGFRLAHLYAERGMTEMALQSAYELRRANYNDGAAHHKYVGILLARDSELDEGILSPKEAKVGSAVCTQNSEDGKQRWYLLEDRGDIEASMNEININSEIGRKLVGKKVGEEVLLSRGSISELKVTISEIKNKYIYALHDSLELLPERFVETRGIERFPIKMGTDEETQESVKKMLDAFSANGERIAQAEKSYYESKLTIGALAHYIGKSVIDVWIGLACRQGARSCIGSVEERKEALSLLANHKTIAIDITALMTAEWLGLLPVLEKEFEKIHVTQSTIDLLLEEISKNKGIGYSRGFLTLWKEGDQLFKHEIASEDINKHVEYLEKLKGWLRKNCVVTPCRTVQRMFQRKELSDILGASFFETILIAQEHGSLLYTDDYGMKAISGSDKFNVSSVWTQVVAMQALSEGILTEEEYNNIAIKLVLFKFRHTTINGAVLLEAAKRSSWSVSTPLKEVIDSLRGPQSELYSTIGATVDFLRLLWRQPIFDFRRDALILAILDVLTDQRNSATVIRLVRSAVQAKFRILPLAEARVQQVISAWESLHIRTIR